MQGNYSNNLTVKYLIDYMLLTVPGRCFLPSGKAGLLKRAATVRKVFPVLVVVVVRQCS